MTSHFSRLAMKRMTMGDPVKITAMAYRADGSIFKKSTMANPQSVEIALTVCVTNGRNPDYSPVKDLPHGHPVKQYVALVGIRLPEELQRDVLGTA